MRKERWKKGKKPMRRAAGLLAVVLLLNEWDTKVVYALEPQVESVVELEAEEESIAEEESSEEPAFTEQSAGQEKADLDYVLGREMTTEEIREQQAFEPSYLPEIEVVELPEIKNSLSGSSAWGISDGSSVSELEESYDVRQLGIYNEIENQYNWGTCWAFSILDLLESSLIQKNLAKQGEMNLSERHLAYFVGNTGYDVLGNAKGDTVVSSPATYYLSRGGNFYYAAMKLMNWHGGAAESQFQYVADEEVPALETECAQEDIAHIENCYWIATKPNDADTIQQVKQMVKQYGGVSWSFYFSGSYMNYSTAAYYNNTNHSTNHAIIIVGWDDTYAKENFGGAGELSGQPAEDGAWIVRNSWGSGWGQEGYFYISYEDVSLGSGNGAAVVTAGRADDYDNNYFYGNTVAYNGLSGFTKAAQVYRIKGRSTEKEQIRGISFMLASADTEYSIQIYKNPAMENGVVTNPESGEALFETPVQGRTSYAGLYTIELPVPVTLSTEDYAAVVITFPNWDAWVFADCSDTPKGSGVWTNTNVTEPGQSFYGNAGNLWTDLHNRGYSFRINMLTDNVEEENTVPVIQGITVTEPDGFDAYVNYKIRWSKCKEAKEYEIYRSAEENGEYTKIGSVGADIRYYNDKAGKEEWTTKYYYKVRAVFEESSEESQAVSAQAEGVLRVKITAADYSKEKITIQWNAVGGADGYRIERKESEEAEYQQIADAADASVVSYTDDVSKLPLGHYEYRVQAYKEGAQTEWSETKTVVKNLKLTPVSYCKVKYDWLPVTNAAKYKLCAVTRDSGYKYTKKWILNAAGLGQNTSYTLNISSITHFQVGDTLEFFVEAYDLEGELLSVSQTAYAYTEPDPLIVQSDYRDGKIYFSWSGGEGADAIYIYRSKEKEVQEGLPYAVITDMETAEFEDASVTEKGTYYYWFYPGVTNSSGTVIYGEVCALQKKLLQAVEIKEVTGQGEQKLKIVWEEVEGADKYTVYRSERAEEGYVPVAEGITEGEYEDGTVVTGKTYYYKVTFYSGEEESTLENTVCEKGMTMPEMPVCSEIAYNRIVIYSRPYLSYALTTADNEVQESDYVNSSEETLTFTGLTPDTEYTILVCTREEVTGEVPVYGEALKVTTAQYPIAEQDQLCAVEKEQKIEAYYLNENSSCRLQVQNQKGELLDTNLFVFHSDNPQICIVNQDGIVTANPQFTGTTDTRVKITASTAAWSAEKATVRAEEEPAERKVEFYVTVLTKKYTDVLEIERITENGNTDRTEKIDTLLSWRFEKGKAMNLAAASYDVSGGRIGNAKVKWKISDTSIAVLKEQTDGTVLVTFKEAGRVLLTCTAQDKWGRSKAIQLNAFSTEPVISAKQVILNKKETGSAGEKISGSFTVSVKNGMVAEVPEIVEIKAQNKLLTKETGAEKFRVEEEKDGSFGIVVAEDFLSKVKANTIYTLTMQLKIGSMQGGDSSEPFVENFQIKLKIVEKEPAVTVKAAQINRMYTQEADLEGLLTIKAADEITNLRVLTKEEGQMNGFEQYFSVKEKGGQWYLQFQDTDGLYHKRSISGKLELTVNGYTSVIRKVTVKTPLSAPSIQQQTIPAIHVERSASASVVLYNRTAKKVFDAFEIQDVQSETLEAVKAENGTITLSVKETTQCRDGAVLTAVLKLMELNEKGEARLKSPVTVKLKLKVYQQKKPVITAQTKKLVLNRQTAAEKGETTLKINCSNVKLLPEENWKIYIYNSRTKQYELQTKREKEAFRFAYEEESRTMKAGFASEADLPEKGSYAVRISNFVEGFEEITKDFTVQVIDKAPKVQIKVKGKLNLIKRAASTLTGSITQKNSPFKVTGVTILNEDKTGADQYYQAVLVNQKEFRIELTEAGKKAAMTTAKATLPVELRLEGGTCIQTTISFQPVQTVPVLKIPKAKTLFKSTADAAVEYDVQAGLEEGVKIKKMDVTDVEEGLKVTAENGSLRVTLENRSIKRGMYRIKVNIYLEGAQETADAPDGKPITKQISVKVAE